MRYLVLADIHGNLEAFQAVLDHAQQQGGFDEVWSLGDVIGYGPDPAECVRRLQALPHKAVAGNHDLAAIGKLGVDEFNPEAAGAALWTSSQLSKPEAEYLSSLPERLEVGGVTLAHGSPRNPAWEYLLSLDAAAASFPAFPGRLCFVGHSHVPLVFLRGTDTGACDGGLMPPALKIESQGVRYIVNPGGVGQPRDGDPRASYILYDVQSDVMQHFRVPYPIATTQAKMLQVGLPSRLIARLSYGR